MPRLRLILATVVTLFALLTLAERFAPLETFVRRLGMPLLLAAAGALAITAVGMLVRRRTSDPALDFLVGYPLFGALCFLVATLSVSAWTMVPLVVIGAVAWPLARARLGSARGATTAPPLIRPSATFPPPAAGRRATEREAAQQAAAGESKGEARVDTAESSTLEHRTSNFAKLCIALVLLCGFVVAQAPPVSLDEVTYHLAVPRAWVLEGRAVELPLLSGSYFPLGIESADLPLLTALGGGGATASHLLHLLAAIAATALILRRTRSWLATAAVVTTPALAATAGWSLVEWPLVGTCIALVIALEERDERTAMAATAAGLLTKYTFLPFALIAWGLSRRWKAALPAIAIGSVFYVRNLILTGNPFAPFFAGGSPHVSGYRGAFLADYIFEGSFIDESLGASLLGMAFGAAGPIGWASLVLAIVLFVLGPSSRILVPFLTVAATSAASLLQKRFLAVLVAIAVIVQTFFVVWLTGRSDAFGLLAAKRSDAEYVAAQRTTYAGISWLNATLPATSRTLIVGHGETFWFTRRVRGGGNFDSERVSAYLAAPTPEALRERLRRDGITHVAVLTVSRPTAVDRNAEERVLRLSPPAQRMLAQTLDRYASSVTSRGSDSLFTLRD